MKTLLLLAGLLFCGVASAQQYSKVKIYTDNNGLETLSVLGLAVDHGEYKEGNFFISDFSQDEIQTLEANGFQYEILIDDVKAYYAKRNQVAGVEKNMTCATASQSLPASPVHHFENNAYAGFYKYQDMLDALDSMATLYPNLITVKAPISTFLTHEGRPVYYVKISDNPATDDASEPNVLYSAIHHAREPLSMSQLIFYMWYLLENYNTDAEVQYLVDNTEMYFVPCLNPDGYIHNEANDPSGFGMHRKNKAPVGTSNPGVDLNRNYSYGWNTTGVSPDPNNDTYPGTSAFSEPETQAMKWLVENVGFKTALNAHTYGNQLLYPIGTTSAEFADHHDYFADLAGHMVSKNGFVAMKSSGLYPASGDSDDYMYKVDIGVGMKDTIFVMTPEIGSDFWPAQGEVEPTCASMIFPNMVQAHVTHKYLVVKDQDPLYVETTSGDFSHSVQRLGFESGNVDVSLVPLLNIQSVGAAISYDIGWHSSTSGTISYTLDPSIQFGDEVKYVLVTNYGAWQHNDTITKIYNQLTPVVTDDATVNTGWTGSWSLTSDAAYSPSTSFTESDGGDYSNNADETYELIQSVDLTTATDALVSFYAKWAIEADYDYCQFQVSTDNGSSWEGQCGLYTVEGESTFWNGSTQPNGEPVWEGASDWVREEISLSQYLGQVIKLRFRFESDGGVTEDGFYFDDFEVAVTSTGGLEDGVIEMKAVPNPANTSFYLHTNADMQNGVIRVYDQTGKLVISQEVEAAAKQIEISVQELPEGAYFVHLEKEGLTAKPTKLIVLH